MTRQPLTLADAQAGVQPEPFTRAEWHALHVASAAESEAIRERTVRRMLVAFREKQRHDDYFLPSAMR